VLPAVSDQQQQQLYRCCQQYQISSSSGCIGAASSIRSAAAAVVVSVLPAPVSDQQLQLASGDVVLPVAAKDIGLQ
jgi:hypothetical protein